MENVCDSMSTRALPSYFEPNLALADLPGSIAH